MLKEDSSDIVTCSVSIAHAADSCIFSTFNWTVPWLSWLAVTVLSIGVIVLYFVPLRYLIMAWGRSFIYCLSCVCCASYATQVTVK